LHAVIVSPGTVRRAGDERFLRPMLPARYSIAKEHLKLALRNISVQIAQLIAEDSLGYWLTEASSEISTQKNLWLSENS
jgi:hypothetical protein